MIDYINNIGEFEIYRTFRIVLEGLGLCHLSETIKTARFYKHIISQPIKTLQTLLDIILDIDDLYKRIINKELNERKRVIRLRKINSVLG